MKLALGALLLLTLCSCKSSSMVGHPRGNLIGLDTFSLAARYGTPASYQHQGEYLQLNYGSATAGWPSHRAGRPATARGRLGIDGEIVHGPVSGRLFMWAVT